LHWVLATEIRSGSRQGKRSDKGARGETKPRGESGAVGPA